MGWAVGNLMPFNMGKRRVPNLGRREPMHQYMLEANQLESSFALLLTLLIVIFGVSEKEYLLNFRGSKSDTCIDF